MEKPLPPIPAKRYFTIGEVGDLCGVKPHVLRYWEQEFTQLRPMKRRGNRRYYQHHEVLMIRRIRDLLYEQGFTISGARNKLQEIEPLAMGSQPVEDLVMDDSKVVNVDDVASHAVRASFFLNQEVVAWQKISCLRRELFEIRDLLAVFD